MGNGDYASAVQQLTKVIEVCPWAPELRELRAEWYEVLEDYPRAISDMRSSTKLMSANTGGFFKLASLYYRLGQVDDSLK